MQALGISHNFPWKMRAKMVVSQEERGMTSDHSLGSVGSTVYYASNFSILPRLRNVSKLDSIFTAFFTFKIFSLHFHEKFNQVTPKHTPKMTNLQSILVESNKNTSKKMPLLTKYHNLFIFSFDHYFFQLDSYFHQSSFLCTHCAKNKSANDLVFHLNFIWPFVFFFT